MAKAPRTAAPAPRTARKEVAARSAGRPRDPRVDEAILDTALEALMAHGFQGMSIDGVAARSGIGKPGIYRRYPNKESLAIAALDRLARSEEHTSELQSLMRISYAVFCLKKKHHQYT